MILPFAASDIVAAEDYIWVEGEAASSRKVQPHNWYSDAVKKEQLSEGAWISHFTDQADGVASYTLNVPAEAEYALWVRANVIGALLSYQVNEGKPTEIDTSKAIDVINIASDGKPDLRIIGWLNGGSVRLNAGKTTMSFRCSSVMESTPMSRTFSHCGCWSPATPLCRALTGTSGSRQKMATG